MKLTEELRTARAAYERQLATELKEHAARSVQPPTGAQVLDLWAHPAGARALAEFCFEHAKEHRTLRLVESEAEE